MNSIFAIYARKYIFRAFLLLTFSLFLCTTENTYAQISSDSASQFKKTIYALSLLHDRFTGSQGAKEAARYIHEHLVGDFSNNPNVVTGIQSFLVPVTQFKKGMLKRTDVAGMPNTSLPPLRLML